MNIVLDLKHFFNIGESIIYMYNGKELIKAWTFSDPIEAVYTYTFIQEVIEQRMGVK